MSKKAKIAVGVVVALVLVLAGVGGWFLHSSMVKKDYEAAWTGYKKEVKAWTDVNERYQVFEPVCGELAGEAECGELKTAGEEAAKSVEGLSLELTKAKSASKEETQKLEKATSEIKAAREKFEPAVEKVEKAAEATIADKFAPVLEEAEKKAGEASGLVGSLKGKVKDENTLKALEGAAAELSTACGKWKGKDIPSGQEGVQAYLELKRLTLTCNDAVTKANESHAQWQAEQKPQGAYPGAGGPRPANAQPWSDYGRLGIQVGQLVCAHYLGGVTCVNSYAHSVSLDGGAVYPVRPQADGVGSRPASTIFVKNGVVDYMNVSENPAVYLGNLPAGSAWYADNYVLGRTAEGITAWDTNSGHGYFVSNDGKRTETF